MTKSLRKKRKRKDLRVAANAMAPMEGAIQLPAYARGLWTPHRYKVIFGGRGGARSWSVARTLLLLAARKKLRILCAREMQSSIKDSVHQLLRDQIELMGLKGFIVTDREITHRNGSLFIFAGLRHNATKIKSLEGIDICWVEEAERISKSSWAILIPTIRKEGSEIWVTFNPDQEDDATYVRFILKPPKDCWTKKVNADDNPWLSPELTEERDYAYATDPESADHVWGGNIRKVSEAQILRGKYIVQEFTVPYETSADGTRIPLWNGPYQGQDFGFSSDPAAAVRLWIHDETLYVEYEMWKLHLEIDDTASQCIDDIPNFDRYTTRADSSRPDSISYLRRHGLSRIVPAKKHSGSVEDGIAHLRSYRQIIIHPRCKHFADEAKHYSYKIDERSGDVLPIVVDKHNHLMDSARYALDPLIRPGRRVGVLFAGTDRRPLCVRCESFLPDDGLCPHCGWSAELDDHLPEEGPDDAAFDADETRASMATIRERVHAVNGNGNGNGHAPKNTGLFGINKR